jgi:hypothetical protein
VSGTVLGMRIMPRRHALAMLLMALLVVGGAGGSQHDAEGRPAQAPQRLGFQPIVDEVLVAPRVAGWQDLVERPDEPLPRTLWPAVAALLAAALPTLLAAGWPPGPLSRWHRRGRVVETGGPRPPPRSLRSSSRGRAAARSARSDGTS